MILHVRIIRHWNDTYTWEVLTNKSKVYLESAPCNSEAGARRAAYRFAKMFPKTKARSKFRIKVPTSPEKIRLV